VAADYTLFMLREVRLNKNNFFKSLGGRTITSNNFIKIFHIHFNLKSLSLLKFNFAITHFCMVISLHNDP